MPEDKIVNLGGTIEGFPTTPIVEGGLASKPELLTSSSINNMFLSAYDTMGKKKQPASDIPYSSFYRGSRYSETRPFTDFEEMSAQQQSSWDKWKNGIGKMVGNAATSFVSGTAGLLYGIGSAVVNQKFSDLFNNDVTRKMDDINRDLEDYAPNYYTHEEQNAGLLSADNIWTANFWSDKVIKNMGFSLGAIAGGVAWSTLFKSIGLTNALVKAGRGMETATAVEKAMATVPKTGQFSAIEDTLNSLYQTYVKQPIGKVLVDSDRILTSVMGTFGESSMEALQNMNSFKEKAIEDYKAKYGIEPTGDDLKEIERYAEGIGTASWGLNSLLLSATNYIQLPKILNSSRKLERGLMNEVKQSGINEAWKEAVPSTTFGKLLKIPKTVAAIAFSPSEAFEEGAQYAIQVGTTDFFDRAKKNKEELGGFFSTIGDVMGTVLTEGAYRTITDREGLENILIGGLSGGLQQIRGTLKEQGLFSSTKKINTETALAALNKTSIVQTLKDGAKFAAIGIGSQKLRQQAIAANDVFAEKDFEHDYSLSYVMPRVKYGKIDSITNELDYYQSQASDNAGFQQLKADGIANEKETKEQFVQRLNDIKQTAKSVDTFYSMINDRYGSIYNEKGNRVYATDVVDKMVYAASKVRDYDERLPQLSGKLVSTGIDTGSIISEILNTGKVDQKTIDESIAKIDDLKSTNADELKTDFIDLMRMARQRKQFFDEYNDIKENPVKYISAEPNSEKTKEPIPGQESIVLKTKDGEQTVLVGERYVGGAKEMQTVEGATINKFTEFDVIGKTEDGNIAIRTLDGKTYNVLPEAFEEYKLAKSKDLSRGARFYIENSDKIFNFRFKGGDEAKGYVIFDKSSKTLYFESLEKRKDGKPRYRIPVKLNQFEAQPGFSRGQIWTNDKFTEKTLAILQEQESLEERMAEERLEAKLNSRREILKNIYDESKKRLDDVDKKLTSKKDELKKIEDELEKLKEVKAPEARGKRERALEEKYPELSRQKQKFTKIFSTTSRAITKLARMKEDVQYEIGELTAQRNELEETIPYFQDFIQNMEELPENTYELIAELKEQVGALKDLVEYNGLEINSFSKLIDNVESTIKDLVSLLESSLKKLDENYPQYIKDSLEKFKQDPTYGDAPMLKEAIEEYLFTQDIGKEVAVNQDKLNDLRQKVNDLYKSVDQIGREQSAKQKILDVFEKLASREEARREQEKAVSKDEAMIKQILGTMNQGVQNRQFEKKYEPDPKKDNKTVLTATVVPSKRSFEKEEEVPAEYHFRANRFGVRFPSLPNSGNIKGVIVTASTESQLIPGLTNHLKQDKENVDASKTIALVMAIPSEDGKSFTLVDENGKPIAPQAETETKEEYNKRVLDSAIYQVFPVNIEGLFRESTLENKDLVMKLVVEYDKWRAQKLADTTLRNYALQASFGFTEKVQKPTADGLSFENDYDARVAVADSGLISEENLGSEQMIEVPILLDTITRGSTTFKNALGRVFLITKNGYQPLNNRQHTEAEAITIHKVINRLSEIIVEKNKAGKFALDQSPEAMRLINWLRTTVNWGSPKEGKFAGYNSVWFSKTPEGFKLFMSGKMTDDGKYTPVCEFTPTALQENKGLIVNTLKQMYQNTNSRLTGKDFYNEKYEQITDIRPDGTVAFKLWPNYQTYLLSTKAPNEKGELTLSRKSEEIPLTTNIRPLKSEEDVNRYGVYFRILDADLDSKYSEMMAAKPAPVKAAPAEKVEKEAVEKPKAKFDVSGQKTNTISLTNPATGNLTFKYDSSKPDEEAVINLTIDVPLIKGAVEKFGIVDAVDETGNVVATADEVAQSNFYAYVLKTVKADIAAQEEAAKAAPAPVVTPTAPVSNIEAKRKEVRAAIQKAGQGEGGQFFVTLSDGTRESAVRISLSGNELGIGKKGVTVDLSTIVKIENPDGSVVYDAALEGAKPAEEVKPAEPVVKSYREQMEDLKKEMDAKVAAAKKEDQDKIKQEYGKKIYNIFVNNASVDELVPVKTEAKVVGTMLSEKERVATPLRGLVAYKTSVEEALEKYLLEKIKSAKSPNELELDSPEYYDATGMYFSLTQLEKDNPELFKTLANAARQVNGIVNEPIGASDKQNVDYYSAHIAYVWATKRAAGETTQSLADFSENPQVTKKEARIITETPGATKEEQERLNDEWNSTQGTPDEEEYRTIIDEDFDRFEGENWTEVEKFLKKVFPLLPVYRTKNVLKGVNGTQAWGMLKNAALYLYENAPSGTAYHEVFEGVWKLFATAEEKLAVENEFKARSGSFFDRPSRQMVEYSKATPKQIKEQLAEEFSAYVKNKVIPKKPASGKSFIVKLFADMWTFFKSFFIGPNAKSNTEQLFEKIGKGYYKKYLPQASALSYAQKGIMDIEDASITPDSELSEIPGLTNSEIHDFMQQMTFILIGKMRKENLTGADIPDIDLSTRNRIYDGIKDFFKKTYKSISDTAQKEAEKDRSKQPIADETTARVRSLFDRTVLNWDKLIDAHQIYLKKYGIEFDENDEVYVREDRTGKGEYDSADKIDYFKKMNSAVKLMLSTLPIVDNEGKPIKSSVDGVKLMPLSEVYISVMNNVHDSLSADDMLDRIRQMAKEDTNYELLYRRLAKTDSNSKPNWDAMEAADIKLLAAFNSQFTKNNPETKILYILPGGGIQVGDANLTSAARQTESEFVNNMRRVMNTPGNKYFEYDKKNKAYIAKKDAVKNIKFGKEIKPYIDFLSSIGIDFNRRDIENLEIVNNELFNKFKEAVVGIRESMDQQKKISTLYGKTLNIGGRLLTLAGIKARIDNPEFSTTYFGVGGERIQTYMGTNPSSDLYNNLQMFPTYESIAGHPQYGYLYSDSFAQNSLILNAIFDIDKKTKTGKRRSTSEAKEFLKTGIASGTINRKNGKKKESSKLTTRERLVQEINMNLEGWYYNLVAGDASLEYMTYMGNHVNVEAMYEGRTDVQDIFRNYLVDEINLAKERRPVPDPKNSSKLRFMDAILGKELAAEVLSSELSAEETVENLKDKIDRAVNKFIKEKTDKFEKTLTDYGVITKEVNEKDLTVDDLGFSETGKISRENLDLQLKALTVNLMIANIEFHKVLYSDPYQYEDELKRIKNFLSPGKPLITGSSSVDRAFDKVYNKGYKKGDAGYVDMTRSYFRTATLADILAFGELKSYTDPWKETDGGGIISLKGHKVLRIRSNNWSDADEAQYRHDIEYERLVTSGASEEQIDEFEKKNPGVKSMYTASKPIVRGNKGNGRNYNDVVLDKFALYPLSLRVIREMDKAAGRKTSNAINLYNKMNSENVDYVVFRSGRKVGAEEETVLYNKDGSFTTEPFKGIVNIPHSIMSIQTDVPSKEDELVTRGSQMTKLATMDYMEAGVPIDYQPTKPIGERIINWGKLNAEKKKTESPIFKEIKNNQDLLEAMTENGYTTLLKRLGIEKRGEEYIITDFSKAAKTLRDEIFKRDVNSNIIQTLNDFLEGKAILEATPAYQQVRNILYSLIDKNIASPKITGGMKVQIPSSFLEENKIKGKEYTTKDGKKKIAYESTILDFYSKTEDGKKVNVCEVMIGRWFDNETTRKMSDKELLAYLNDTPEGQKILRGVGFRIPTQKQNSIDVFKIKQFLPKEFGDNIVVPSALVLKAGSDFDIDKLSIYLKNVFFNAKGLPEAVPYFGIGEEARQKIADMFDKGEFLTKSQMQELDRIIEEERDILYSKQLDVEGKEIGTAQQQFLKSLFSNLYSDQAITEDFVKSITKDGWKEKFVDDIYKKSLENAYVESLENLVSHPLNFEQLVKPNSAEQLKNLSKDIVRRLGEENLESLNIGNMLDRVFMTKLRHAFVSGKYAIGIAAVGQTNHSLNQRQPVYIDLRKLTSQSKVDQFWLKDGKIKFDNFNQMVVDGREVVSLSGIKNADGQYISDIIGQFIDGYVDISKGPWIMELGATPNVAGTWLFLAKIGVPIDTIAYFINQPIIRDYLRSVENAGYSYLFIEDFVDLVKDDYATTNDQLKKITKIPSKEKLYETIGETEFDAKGNAEQQFILDEFLKYAKMAEQLLIVQQGTNYDTAVMNDPFLVFKKNELYKRAKTSIISSAEDILKNSFLGKLRTLMNDGRNAVAEFLISDKGSVRNVLENVLRPYIKLSDRDFLKLARKAVNDLFDWAVQISDGRNMLINTLLMSDNNAPKQIAEFKKQIENDPNHALYNNHIIGRNGILIMETSPRVGGVNNLSVKNKESKVYDQDQIISSFREIRDYLNSIGQRQLYKKIVGVSILQSGLSTTPFSYTSLLPYEDFTDIYNEVLYKLENSSDIDLNKYFDLAIFQRNNWNDDDIVPNEIAKRSKFTGKYNTNMNFSRNKPIQEAMNKGEIPPLLKLSTRSASAYSDVVAYSWEVIPTGKTKDQMIREKDFSFIKRGLFKKVYFDKERTRPVIDSFTIKDEKTGKIKLFENHVYQMINAWGDSFRANEFYDAARPSIIDNGFEKVEGSEYNVEFTILGEPIINKRFTSPERDDSAVNKFYGADTDEQSRDVVPSPAASISNIKPTINLSREWKGDLKTRPVYTSEGINTMRTEVAKSNEHFGNPFSEAGYGDTIKVDSIGEAVVNYKDWLLGNKFQNVKPEQRAWILDQINQGKLDGATLLYAGKSAARGQGMHPTALAEVVEQLRATQPMAAKEVKPANLPAIKQQNKNNC